MEGMLNDLDKAKGEEQDFKAKLAGKPSTYARLVMKFAFNMLMFPLSPSPL
jgi:hypothetical protein